MSTLYIANCTTKKVQFMFRKPESQKVHMIPIDPGGQQAVPNLSPEEMDSVVKQHEEYGMLSADQVSRMKGTFVGLCYSTTKPITQSQIMGIHKSNEGVLESQGLEARKRAAVANSNTAAQADPRGGLMNFETEIVEQVGPTERPGVNEKLQVTVPGEAPRRGRRRAA